MTKLKFSGSVLLLLISSQSMAADYAREINTNRDSSAGISVGVTPIPGGKYQDAFTYSSVVGENGCRGTVTWESPDKAAKCKSDVEILLKHSQSVGVADSVKGDAPHVGTGTATATCNNGAISLQDQTCEPLGCRYDGMQYNFVKSYMYEESTYSVVCNFYEDALRYSGEMAHGQVITFYDNISGIQKSDYLQGQFINSYPTGYLDIECNNGVASAVLNQNFEIKGTCSVSDCYVAENYNWDVSQSTPRRHQGESAYERIVGGSRTSTYNNCKPKSALNIPAGPVVTIKDAEDDTNYIKVRCDPATKSINIRETVCN